MIYIPFRNAAKNNKHSAENDRIEQKDRRKLYEKFGIKRKLDWAYKPCAMNELSDWKGWRPQKDRSNEHKTIVEVSNKI